MTSVLTSVLLPSLPSLSLPSSSISESSEKFVLVNTTSWVAGASTHLQVQSMTSTQLTSINTASTTNRSLKPTMPDDSEPTVTTHSSSKTPVEPPTISTSSGARPTSHSTTSSSSRHETSTSASNKPQSSQKPDLALSIGSPQTTTSVSVENNPSRSTRTSTITDRPESTFSRVVPVTLTNNGTIAVSTPAMVTVLTTSTLPDGDFVTYTHIVANPTGFNDGNEVFKTSGFLGNHGAVAGVFVVVGVIVAVIGLCFVFLFRRHLRRTRHRRWLEGMRQQDASSLHNPFEDPNNTPHMRAIVDDSTSVSWAHREPREPGVSLGIQGSMHSSSSQRHSDVGLVGIGSGMRSPNQTHTGDVWNGTHQHNTDFVLDHNLFHSGASIAPSSPSIYPASLPPDVDNSIDETQHQLEMPASSPAQNPFVAEPPPRPPRSILRRNSTRAPEEMYPLTPPASVSSHSHSKPPSPIADSDSPHPHSKGPHDIFNRRTLLDIRPRTSPDSQT